MQSEVNDSVVQDDPDTTGTISLTSAQIDAFDLQTPEGIINAISAIDSMKPENPASTTVGQILKHIISLKKANIDIKDEYNSSAMDYLTIIHRNLANPETDSAKIKRMIDILVAAGANSQLNIDTLANAVFVNSGCTIL
ncbi:MAG: hypothetical protein WC436_05120 [Candidatus Babeliales bacterium]